jgi:heat shock protein HslJ
MSKVNKFVAVLGCLLILSSCVSPSGDSKLNGTRWILQMMHGWEMLEDTAITLRFTEAELSGSSGCNLYFSKYIAQSKNRIEIKELANTEMACSEPAGIMDQEEEYLSIFRRISGYVLENGNLFLMDEQGIRLLEYRPVNTFTSNPESLIGRTWRLLFADGLEEYNLDEFTLLFDGSRFRGTTSCRDYEGEYQTTGSNISITFLEMTSDVECRQQDLLAEGTYTTLLGWIDQYNVLGNQLELYTVQNDKLIYETVPGE